MSTYVITGPDGKKYRVTAPEGATQEQVLARVRAKATSAPAVPASEPEQIAPKTEKAKDSWYQDLGQGIAESGIRTWLGAKDLFGKASEAEKQSLADLSADADESGWGTAGNVVGEVAQLAVPGAIGGKVLKLATAARPAAALAGTIGLEAALSGGHGAIRLPKARETRTGNAIQSAAMAGAGAAAGKLLRPLVGKPLFEVTPEAKKLMAEGVFLTPGQAAKSPTVHGIESIMEVTPGLARGTKNARERGIEEWAGRVLKRAVPKASADKVTDIGQEGFKQAKKIIDDGYTQAWGKASNLDPTTVPLLKRKIHLARRVLPVEARPVLNRLQENLKTLDPQTSLRTLDDALKKARKSAKGNFDLTDFVNDMRDTLRSGLPSDAQQALKVMDEAYPGFLATRNAVARAAENEGKFTPQMLMRASAKIGGESRAAMGEAPLQDIAEAGLKTVGKKQAGQPLEWFRRIAASAPTPLPMQTVGRGIMAETKPQRLLNKSLEKMTPKELEDYITMARLGAAYED